MTAESIMDEVRAERKRQDFLYGPQNHPNGTSVVYRAMEDSARNSRVKARESNSLSWFHIMREVFWESVSKSDRVALRANLVKLVAVGVAWIESIDRNP